MADLTGANDTSFTATPLGNLGYVGSAAGTGTADRLSIEDSTQIIERVSLFGVTRGDDPLDNFVFNPSGLTSVTVTFSTGSSGFFADLIGVAPTSGVTAVNGAAIATRYGGYDARSDAEQVEIIDETAENSLEELRAGGVDVEADMSGTDWSKGQTVASAEWLLDGNPVIFEVSGVLVGPDMGGASTGAYHFDEITYSITITPSGRNFFDGNAQHLLFQNAPQVAQTHTGGDGIDYYVLDGSRSQFTLQSWEGDTLTVARSGNSAFPDILESIERIQLTDGFLAFDTDGNAGQVYRLYQAAFDRDPDVAGLGFWIETFDRDVIDLVGIAGEFLISEEFKVRFGTEQTLDDDAYLTLLYNNVLDRDPDQAGFDFWSGHQANGLGRAEMLHYFSESAENYANVAGEIADGIFYV